MLLLSIFLAICFEAHAEPMGSCRNFEELIAHHKKLPRTFIKPLEPLFGLELTAFIEKGGSPEGDIRFAGGGTSLTLELPHKGENWKGFTEAVADVYWPSSVVVDLGQEMLIEALEGSWTAVMAKGRVLIRPLNTLNTAELPVFAGELDAAGCIFVMDGLNLPIIGALFSGRPVALVYPFEEGGLELRGPAQMNPTQALLPPKKKAVSPMNSEIPAMLRLSLGESPLTLLSSDLIPEARRISQKEALELQKKITIPSGGFARVKAMKPLDFELSLPVVNYFGCPMSAWRLWLGVKRGSRKLNRTFVGSRHMRITVEEQSVDVAVEKGRVLISSAPNGMSELRKEHLQTGSEGHFSKISKAWPVAMEVAIPPDLMFLIGPLVRLEVGIHSEKNRLRMGLSGIVRGKVSAKRIMVNAIISVGGVSAVKSKPIPASEISVRHQLAKLAALLQTAKRKTGMVPVWSRDNPPEKGLGCFGAEALLDKLWVEVNSDGFLIKAATEDGGTFERNAMGIVRYIGGKSNPSP